MTIADIPTFVIALASSPRRRLECTERLRRQGVDFQFFDGFDGRQSGLITQNVYEIDNPGSGHMLLPYQIGIYMSHWILWNSLLIARRNGWTTAPAFMICEDDATFLDGWQDTINASLATVPENWDYLAPGNCDCGEINCELQRGVKVYELRPLCTHCYIVRTGSLEKLIDPLRKIWAPLDLAMYFDAFPSMATYAILPRCVDQVDMHLNP